MSLHLIRRPYLFAFRYFGGVDFIMTKGGVKMHTLYDVKTDIPSFFVITNGDIHDSKVMHMIPYEQGALYIFDRGYMDTSRLSLINKIGAFFVVREKHSMVYEVVDDKNYNNPKTGVMADQLIKFSGAVTKKNYPDIIRRIVFYDAEGNRTFVFYTNNMSLSAEDIALAYKYRWRVEPFLQMDQATPSCERILWYYRECCKDTTLLLLSSHIVWLQ